MREWGLWFHSVTECSLVLRKSEGDAGTGFTKCSLLYRLVQDIESADVSSLCPKEPGGLYGLGECGWSGWRGLECCPFGTHFKNWKIWQPVTFGLTVFGHLLCISVSWVSASWYWFRSWSQAPRMEPHPPHLRLCTQQGICFSPSSSPFAPHPLHALSLSHKFFKNELKKKEVPTW